MVRVGWSVCVGRRRWIHLVHGRARENLRRWTRGPDLTVQKDQGLSMLGHVLNVMGGAEECQVLGSLEVTHLGVEALSGGRVEAGSGFIQDQKTGVSHEGTGNQGPLLLATGKVLEPPSGQMSDPDFLQRLRDLCPVRPSGAPHEAQISVSPHKDHIRDGERETAREFETLRDIPDGLAVFSWRPAEQRDLTSLGLEDPQEETQDGGFPGAVGANHGREGTSRHFQGNALQDPSGTVREVDISQFEDRPFAARTGHAWPLSKPSTSCRTLKRRRLK